MKGSCAFGVVALFICIKGTHTEKVFELIENEFTFWYIFI